ncbi:MAG: SDR family oxidoreductase [Rubellimicrobium sp.]|nr:SDR family oxidoreductase [Rubellimicrobium sp.]
MNHDLENLRVAIIGAATGIGRAVAEGFAAHGARLALADLSPAVTETARATGATAITGDVAQEQDATRMVAEAVAALGGLDVLINVAGVQIVGEATETTIADWDRLMAINLRGPFLTCRAAIPHLAQSTRGAILNTASIAGLRGGPGGTAYAASKGGLIAFSTALALELAPRRITVNTICPGWVDTGFNAPIISHLGGAETHARLVAEGVPLGRQAAPVDIAPTYLFLASMGARYITAKAMAIDGGLVS